MERRLLMRWLASFRERLTGLLFRSQEEAGLDEELRFHLDMEAERLEREEGLDPTEARRRAHVAFGGVDRTKERVREARGLGWLTGWWLDVKLAGRMLVKHPGLTVLGSLAMAFAIFTGAGAFEIATQVVRPSLPLPEGERIVGIRVQDVSTSRTESRLLHDLGVWRRESTTLDVLGAYLTVERNLVTDDGRAEPVTAAAMDAEGFRVARVAPRLGRTLVEDDERADAPPVAVIGHDLWTRRFGGDPGVVGTTVRLGDTPTTVVGVMPEGFGFPVAHEAWVPFDSEAEVHDPREGPRVAVFGRLAPGASLDDARAELEVLRQRIAASSPTTHAHLRPRVLPWAEAALGLPSFVSSLMLVAVGVASNLPLLLFLVLVCGNVALLMFARAASREDELAVRSALGASRSRIVLQLFVEALALAAVAAVVGLAAARYGVAWMFRITESVVLNGNPLPFWFRDTLSSWTLFYALLLTVLCAAVAGVLPGLKVTRGLRSRLQQATAGGGGFRFGGIWTAVIVAQIAITMIFPIVTIGVRSVGESEILSDLDLADERYLAARLESDGPTGAGADTAGAAFEERFRSSVERLAERLRAEPRVAGVAFAERLPRQYHYWRQVEVDGPTAEPRDERGHRLGATQVTLDYFDLLDARVVAGRGFRPGDLAEDVRVVVVNEAFVERVMGGRDPVGRQVRYLATEEYRDPRQEPGPWHEIVGVVEDLGTRSGYGEMGMYHPAEAGGIHPVHALVHVSGDPRTFAPTLQRLATEVDATLRVPELIRLDEVTRGQEEYYAFWSTLLVAVSAIALLLSVSGIFAVMSYTVSRRTREIGIRVALGASRRRVVLAIFRRPLAQIALGLLAGGVMISAVFFSLEGMDVDPRGVAVLVSYVVGMASVLLLACVQPTLRALAVEPAEALRADG